MIEWEEPPPKLYGQWARVAAELKERPGVWACVVRDEDQRYAYNSVQRALRRCGCEVTTRSVAKRVSVWARWPE